MQPHVEAALSGKSTTLELEVTHPGGYPGFLEATLVPDAPHGSQVQGFYVLAHDITARKRAGVALATNEERLRQLLESTNFDYSSPTPGSASTCNRNRAPRAWG